MSHVQKAIDELQEKRNEAIEYTSENRKSLDVIPEADDLDQLEREEEEERGGREERREEKEAMILYPTNVD